MKLSNTEFIYRLGPHENRSCNLQYHIEHKNAEKRFVIARAARCLSPACFDTDISQCQINTTKLYDMEIYLTAYNLIVVVIALSETGFP